MCGRVCMCVVATKDFYRMSIRQIVQMRLGTLTQIYTYFDTHILSHILVLLCVCVYVCTYVCKTAHCLPYKNPHNTFLLPYLDGLYCVPISANFAAPLLYLYIPILVA